MKLKELLDQLSGLSPDYNEAELEMSVTGKYDEHNLSLRHIGMGTRGYDDNLRNILFMHFSYINEPDEVKKGEELRPFAAKLKINFSVMERFVDECKDFINFTKKKDGVWREIEFVVNLSDHSIVDWKKKNGRSGYLFCKVVDNGTYTLLDETDGIVKQITGYVPNHLIPEEDGYGDYITLKVTPEGFITNWSKDDSFHEFLYDPEE